MKTLKTLILAGTLVPLLLKGQATDAPDAPTVTASAATIGPGASVTFTADRPVTFHLRSNSPGTLVTLDATHAVFTGSASPENLSSIAGCASFPNDSILNTAITRLPVHPESANWLSQITDYRISVEPTFTHTIITATDYPTLNMKYYYGGSTFNVPVLTWPNKKRENGWAASAGDNADHHSLTIISNADGCHFYELYNDVVSPTDVYTCRDGSSACNAQSGDDYTPFTYTPVAGTDAAGLPQYLVLRVDEIKNNAIHHPTRFTLARGFIQGVTGTTPNIWPASGTNGWGGSNTVPFGARLRLRADYKLGGKSQYAKHILNSFKHYGLILADSGSTGAIQTDTDVWTDPSVLAAVDEAVSGLTFADFDVVDESSLMLTPESLKVNPASPYYVPHGVVTVVATDAQPTNGQQLSTTMSVSLAGIGIGLKNPQVSAIVTGAPFSYDFGADAWLTGTSNQGLTWTLTSGPGSVTSFGVYSFPTSVPTVTPVVLTATAAADSQTSVNQYILLYPGSDDGSFRTALGGQLTDDLGNTWWKVAGLETGTLIQLPNDYPSWASLNGSHERAIYQSDGYTYGADMNWRFLVPNGNYKVRFLMQEPYDGCKANCVIHPDASSPVIIGVNGQLAAHWYLWGAQVNYQVATPWDYLAPAKVTDNVLSVTYGRVNPDGDSYHASPGTSGIEIIPDSSSPHIAIDTGMESWSAGGSTVTTKPLSVPVGSAKQLYAVGWYMDNSVTWSLNGVGSIDAATGLYTAPAHGDGVSHTVAITAVSTADSSKTATATLIIPAS
jgi:hypothetical protein